MMQPRMRELRGRTPRSRQPRWRKARRRQPRRRKPRRMQPRRILEGCSLEGSNFERGTFEGCTFEGGGLEGGGLEGGSLEGGRVKGGNLDCVHKWCPQIVSTDCVHRLCPQVVYTDCVSLSLFAFSSLLFSLDLSSLSLPSICFFGSLSLIYISAFQICFYISIFPLALVLSFSHVPIFSLVISLSLSIAVGSSFGGRRFCIILRSPPGSPGRPRARNNTPQTAPTTHPKKVFLHIPPLASLVSLMFGLWAGGEGKYSQFLLCEFLRF